MIKPINVSKKLSDGREISIETGKLAKQADGSIVLTMGKTMILASVVSKSKPSVSKVTKGGSLESSASVSFTLNLFSEVELLFIVLK